MTYQEAEAYLLGLPRFAEIGAPAYRPGLERISDLLDAMGRPQDRWTAIHVAGTNGKGSTASMLASVASALGLRTGLHTSPHLIRLGERMRIDGVPATEGWIAGAVERHLDAMRRVSPSFFEATTALSFLYFAEMHVRVAAVEVGMGGRYDATNVLHPRLCVITHIGFDHVEFLGPTLTDIAREKAGIIKPRTPVLLAPSPPDVTSSVASAALELEAPLHLVEEEVRVWGVQMDLECSRFSAETPRRRYEGLRIGRGGSYQIENAALALRAAELTWPEEAALEQALRAGFDGFAERTGLRGRLEIVSREPLLVVDVAHNADGIGRVVDVILNAIAPRRGRLHVVLALMADKDAPAVAALLAACGATTYCVDLAIPRALPPEALARTLSSEGVAVASVGGLTAMVERARSSAGPQDAVLATGSHFLVGELLSSV